MGTSRWCDVVVRFNQGESWCGGNGVLKSVIRAIDVVPDVVWHWLEDWCAMVNRIIEKRIRW